MLASKDVISQPEASFGGTNDSTRTENMNVSKIKIASIDVGEDRTCLFYDEQNNRYFDGSYTGAYSVGDLVSVGWSYFGGENREVLWVERIG